MLPLKRLHFSKTVFAEFKPLKSDEEKRKNLKISKTVYPSKPDEVYKVIKPAVQITPKKVKLRIEKSLYPEEQLNYSDWHKKLNISLVSFKGY